MWSTDRQIAAGDTVIVWLTRDQIQPLVVTPGKDFNTKFGNFRQSDFVGVPYGSKVVPKSGRGFIYILRPTPELWTLALPHRTQILYLADIAFITSYLGIKKGSKVIEAGIALRVKIVGKRLTKSSCSTGTGSASFSHSVARTIGLTGHLWSYEFHEARFIKAKEEFTRHGMDDRVTIQHRNVCKEGFSVMDQVDAVFLDLPAPWDAVEHAKEALRKDCNTRICCFSPCIEQVLRTVNKLNETGFAEITTYETLLRPIEVFHTPALQPVSVVSEKLKESEKKREEKRQRQIQDNRAKQMEKKRKREEREVNGTTDADQDRREAVEDAGVSKKRTRTTEDREGREDEMDVGEDLSSATTTMAVPLSDAELDVGSKLLPSPEMTTSPAPTLLISTEGNPTSDGPVAALATPHIPTTTLHTEAKINVSKALPEVRGHTSYLTFACLIPISSSVSSSSGSTSSSVASNETHKGIGTRSAKSDPPE